MKDSGNKCRLLILYGSQTGTSQDLAELIWRESHKRNFTGPVMAMDDYDIGKLIEEKLVVFVCATTGQGDEPDNMKKFWKFLLRKSLPRDSLTDMTFGVLGLGDSSYAKFNFVAKRLHKRLLQLSARNLLPLGLCDDQHDLGPSAVYLNWIQDLWNALSVFNPSSKILSSSDSRIWQYRWRVEKTSGESHGDATVADWPLNERTFPITLEKNIRTTTEDHFQDVRFLSFSINSSANWEPGDVVAVKPNNPDEKVKRLFELFKEHNLDFDANTVVSVNKTDNEMPVPLYFQKPIRLGLVAKHLWDLNAIPRQRAFELLALNCKDELEQEKLIEFTTPEGLEDMYNYTSRPRRTILEVLHDFPHATSALTIPVLFELFSIIQPRLFSIASSRKSNKLEILVAVVEYKLKLSEPRRGLCSNWLKDLQVGTTISASFRKGTMKIPRQANVPLIMVGPGTGLAPFRSILMDRWMENDGKGRNVLFFGCRSQFKDFHCKADLQKMEDEGIVKCYYAFSRDQDHKVYVQHKIEEAESELKPLIFDEHATILVAGNSKDMPQSVKEAFTRVVGSADYIEKMIKEGRYQEETWS